MRLAPDQRLRLREQGFIQVPAAIPRAQVDAALRAVNASLGQGVDPAQLATYRAQSFCLELVQSPVITDLFNRSPAIALASALIGAVEPVTGGQIALRFPSLAASAGLPPPHLDGMYTPSNGVVAGSLDSFTALACVLLSDLPGCDAGNFSVWPGSHLRHAAHLRAHGARSLLAGMPPLALGAGLQITGRAGDLILAHYLLGHTVAPNLAPHVRYAVFFRLRALGHRERQEAALGDPWLEWPGLADPR